MSAKDTGGRRAALLAAALFALVLGLFWPATRNGFVAYDDPRYVTENPVVQGGLTVSGAAWAFRTFTAANWHPVTWLSHMADCQWFGLDPRGHHFTSILLHAVNAALLFLLLRRITGTTWRAWIAAALFAIHPLRVESVAWISERKDVLSTFFGLLAIWAYAAGNLKSQISNLKFICLSAFLYTLSLMSKPMLVTLPLLLLLLDFWPLGRFARSRLPRLVLEKLPFALLALGSCVVTWLAQRSGGAMTSMARVSAAARWENAAVSYVRYLLKSVWPSGLSANYPVVEHWAPGVVVYAVILLGLISAAAWLTRRAAPWFFTGWSWYLAALTPVLGLVAVGEQSMADRYTYVPFIGLAIVVAWGAAALAAGGRPRAMALAAALAAAITLVAVTREAIGWWRDTETLFGRVVSVTENSRFNDALGNWLVSAGRINDALPRFETAVAIDPGSAAIQVDDANALLRAGRLDEAIEHYRRAVAIEPGNPDYHNNLGAALSQGRRDDPAIGEFREAVRLKPGAPQSHSNLALALARRGSTSEALQEWREAARLDPNNPARAAQLASALARFGSPDEAIAEYRRVLSLDPKLVSARNDLATLLAQQGRLEEAAGQFKEIVGTEPGNEAAHFNYGLTLAQLQKWNEAAAQFQETLRINPSNTTARQYLDQLKLRE
ncbi:MAG: tetratricopeptide repeat protein [Verrucomicrobiota bacterium]